MPQNVASALIKVQAYVDDYNADFYSPWTRTSVSEMSFGNRALKSSIGESTLFSVSGAYVENRIEAAAKEVKKNLDLSAAGLLIDHSRGALPDTSLAYPETRLQFAGGRAQQNEGGYVRNPEGADRTARSCRTARSQRGTRASG